MPDTFKFDRRTQRYRYLTGERAGQFVAESRVQELTQSAIALIQKDIGTIGDLLIQGKINTATWESETALALKKLHAWNYLLGKGGEKRMTQRDRALLASLTRTQYGYLRQFSLDIIQKGMSQEQFKARLNLYSEAAAGTYEKARFESHINEGFTWERRFRTKIESCDDCLYWASIGWQPIGSLPNRGERCQCKARCGCYKSYSKERPKDSLTRQRWGWLA